MQDPYKTLEIIRAVHPTVVVPHSEESVLCAGLANTELGLPGVSLVTAIACTDRLTQRQFLHSSKLERLNPQWCRLVKGEYEEFIKGTPELVVKAPISTLSRGVAIARNSDNLLYIDKQLRRRCYDLIAKLNRVMSPSCSLVEEFIYGDSIEVSGVVGRDGKIKHRFRPLHQRWVDNRITQYSLVLDLADELCHYATDIVKAFEMRSCGYSIEFKGPPWKVIEVHCRIGEDGGDYEELISPKKPSAQWLYDTLCT